MERRKNGDKEKHSERIPMNAISKPSDRSEELHNSDNEDVISLYTHSDYEMKTNDYPGATYRRRLSNTPEHDSYHISEARARRFQNSDRRDGSPSKTYTSCRSADRRFSRGRKKWAKHTGEFDCFGHNTVRNPPGRSSRGNKGSIRRPYFSKYSPHFSPNSHTRTRGILGDAPSRRPMTQFKSCVLSTNVQDFKQIHLENATSGNKLHDFNDYRNWRQTSIVGNNRLHWSNDTYDKNMGRNRRNYRANDYRRPLNRTKSYASPDGMHTNPCNNETSEEGNESPKLESVGENAMSGFFSRDMDDCDPRHPNLDSNRHPSNKTSSDTSFIPSKVPYYQHPDTDPHQTSCTNRSSLLPTPDLASFTEYGPPAKKRAALLPTPTETETSATPATVASSDLEKVSEELKPVSSISVSSPSENVSKVLSPKRRNAEKTATVAPLQKVSTLVPSRLTDLAEDAESRHLVTPPIEVSYIVDAPPRPPNPGPTYVISSNSNSPAASRPSSRSGRFVGYEPTRSATPDVPPRPVNPPPPVCAPSPASTPEGMPPRPQNPGPPLDVSLSTMSARAVPSTSATTFHVVPVSCSSTGGLLPFPAHSKLPTARPHASPGEEPSPAHGAVSRLGMLQSAANTLSSTVASSLASDLPLKTLLPLPDKESSPKQPDSSSEADKHDLLEIREYENTMPLTERNGNAQTAVIDLSKPTSVPIDATLIHEEQANCKDTKRILPSPESLISKTQSHVSSSCATLSFSTTVVNSSSPISSCLSASRTKTPESSKTVLLPTAVDKDSETDEVSCDDSKLSKTFLTTEAGLKERIITCLREKKFADGLLALREALQRLPEKFGDGEVYEVIEYFGQNEAYEYVVPAALLVRSPDERLLQFLTNIVEQVPEIFKEKRNDIWVIYNDALNKNPNLEVIDSCIKCFAVLECWNKVWSTLQLHPSSVRLPPSTITSCLQSLASSEGDKYLQAGVTFLSSLSVITKRGLDIDVVNSLWLRCAELGLTEAVTTVDLVLKLIPQSADAAARHTSRVQAFLMGHMVADRLEVLSNFVASVGASHCQQFLDFFVAGFMVSEEPVSKVFGFIKQLRQRSRSHDPFSASLCVRFMRQLAHRHAWGDAFELWRLVCDLGIACERQAVLDGESQTTIAFLALEVSVRHSRYDAAVSMLSESLVLGQPWTDAQLVRKRVCLLREIFERSIDNNIDFAAAAFKALLSTKDTDQAILHDYGRIIDIMTIYNDYLVAACHQGSLDPLNAALDLVSIAHNKQLLVKPTVLRYLVVACVRFKLHTKAKEFLQRGMTVSIYPTIDVHSNLLLLPTDLATEEIAALLLLYLMLLKEYLVQALNASRVGGEQSSTCAVDVLQACGITVVPNNVNLRDREFTERFHLVCTDYGLLQRVQAILASGGIPVATPSDNYSVAQPVDYLKSPISAELTYEGGRSVLKLNTSEVYNNVYYIDPPSE